MKNKRNSELSDLETYPYPKLAIVIPYYKISFFNKTLSSLAGQTNKNFNVYVGDDASPANPKSIVLDYKKHLNICYHRFDCNLGGVSLTKQWERCIELIDEESWVMLLADDDYLKKNCVEQFYKHLEKAEVRNIKVIRFATIVFDENSNEFSKTYTHPELEKSTDFFYKKFLGSSRGSLSEHVFKKEAYSHYGFRHFPLGWGADTFAWLDFSEFGYIYTINSASVIFRMSLENISRANYMTELKNKTRYHYFSIIIFLHLEKFRVSQRLKLLLFYEQLARHAKQTDLKFYFKMIPLILRHDGIMESIKFSRRCIFYNFNL